MGLHSSRKSLTTSPDVKKRIIGAITVRHGIAVQSFEYRRYLPLGDPVRLVENLDRWGVDEIAIQSIDRNGLGPDLDLLRRISSSSAATPILYGGGIRSVHDAVRTIANGADRVTLDTLVALDTTEVFRIAHHLGAQAVIAVLTCRRIDGKIAQIQYLTGDDSSDPSPHQEVARAGAISEIMVVDADGDGTEGAFNLDCLEFAGRLQMPMIALGGMSSGVAVQALQHPYVQAVGVGNAFSYSENAVQQFKLSLIAQQVCNIRFPYFATEPEEFGEL